MIIVTPPALYGYIGAILSALIIVLCAIGLTLHKDVYNHIIRKDFYCYYTNLSCLIVLVYFSVAAPRLYAYSALRPYIPLAEFSVTMAILLTHLVFHFMIFPTVREVTVTLPPCRDTRILTANNLVIHYLMPWLVFAYWLLCSPGKQAIPLYAAFLWTLLPLAYAAGIFLRARTQRCIAGTQSPYPYPFLDVNRLGKAQVARSCALLFALCVLLSGALILLARLMYGLFGSGKALFLI